MKKSFLFHIRLLFAVVCLTTSVIFLPAIIKAQPPGNPWWTLCCTCGKSFVVDPKPPGYCRHCHLLCPNCRKELGELNQALEKLKEKNQRLYGEYKTHQRNSTKYNEDMIDAMVKTYGKESGAGWDFTSWNAGGLNSSIGKFLTASAGVATNFTGVGLPVKLVTYVIPILQTPTPKDEAVNIGTAMIDILTHDGIMQGLKDEMLTNAEFTLCEALKRGVSTKTAYRNWSREVKSISSYSAGMKMAEFGSVVWDLMEFYNAANELVENVTDWFENYYARLASEKERKKVQREILANLKLMECVKETLDSLNQGGLGVNKLSANNLYAVKMVIGYFFREIPEKMWSSPFLYDNKQTDMFPYYDIDTIKAKSAILQLKKLRPLLKTMAESFENEIIPPLIPWISDRWRELKPETQVQLVKDLKSPLNILINNYKTVNSLTESTIENLRTAVIGYEIDYLHAGSTSFEIISSANNALGKKNEKENSTSGNNKWTSISNEKIKGEFGRLNMSFPAGVDWSLDFYTPENKFVTNRSSFSKHQPFYDITPGKYNIKFNHVIVENVPVEKGKEVKLKAGFLNIITYNPWEFYNESKEKYYTSGIKPVKFALPVGTYQLKFEGKYYRIIIKEGVTVKFESPIPGLID